MKDHVVVNIHNKAVLVTTNSGATCVHLYIIGIT